MRKYRGYRILKRYRDPDITFVFHATLLVWVIVLAVLMAVMGAK